MSLFGNNVLWVLIWLGVMGPVVVLIIYYSVRVASLAHFRTRLEYLRSAMRELKGEVNGNE